MELKVHKILKHTKVEGPGVRYCIWTQGCSRHCKGCWAISTWDKNGGMAYDTKDILSDIFNTKNIEGVTFLGGEPFEQPKPLQFLTREIKKSGLSVVCFTGNKIEDLEKKYKNILKNIDILIDGEYIEEEKDFSRPWVGSKNQRYHFLSDRYNESVLKNYKNHIEVNVQKNGVVFINGMGDFDSLVKKINFYSEH